MGRHPLGTELPAGARFIGTGSATPGWRLGRDAPTPDDLSTCVACGLCLPHCPTYRLTGEESASPRGRIAAMNAVATGADLTSSFSSFMDLCLVCRACEDVCPSHVPFGRMMEAAREQIEPTRSRRARFLHWLGFHWLLPHPSLIRLATAVQPLIRPVLPRRVRELLPGRTSPFATLPRVTEPSAFEVRGTVALLTGCVQDRWFHHVNLATIRVLTRAGWRVTVPRGQACCGALAAHNGRLGIARRLAKRARHAFTDADVVIVNAAGCSAHMKAYEEFAPGTGLPVEDLMTFLATQGLGDVTFRPLPVRVAYHDACHALRAQHIHDAPRALLARIRELELVEIVDGDRCCGAAGIYAATQPEMAGALGGQKAAAVAATGAAVVASANPGCSVQLATHLSAAGMDVAVMHPIELLDRAVEG
ncbi:MAG: (Fe-S)-binding protein [Actinomycetota bacterium]|nr:(Fe-S)-binding protein [Actinomycetota bacterium]